MILTNVDFSLFFEVSQNDPGSFLDAFGSKFKLLGCVWVIAGRSASSETSEHFRFVFIVCWRRACFCDPNSRQAIEPDRRERATCVCVHILVHSQCNRDPRGRRLYGSPRAVNIG